MKRRLNSLAFAVFTLTVIVSPASHRIHLAGCGTAGSCSQENREDGRAPEKHDREHCAICQLALTPLIAGAPVAALAPAGTVYEIPLLSIPAPAVSAACVLPYSCGPPA